LELAQRLGTRNVEDRIAAGALLERPHVGGGGGGSAHAVAARPAGRDQSQKSTTRSSGWESREHSLDQERG